MLLRKHEDRRLRELELAAVRCGQSWDCQEVAEQMLADARSEIEDSRSRRKKNWTVCSTTAAQGRNAAASREVFPIWAIVLIVGGGEIRDKQRLKQKFIYLFIFFCIVCLVICLSVLFGWLLYKRKQERILEEITRSEMVYG